MEHGHHVLRACAKTAVLRMYEKFSTFLRLEVLSNNLHDFGLKKSLDNLETVRQTLAAVSDRFAAFEAQALDVHVDFPLFQRLALPIPSGNTKIPGIRSMTPVCSVSWTSCSTAAPNSADGAPVKSTKPSSPPSNSPQKTTPLPNSAMTCANSKPMPYWSATAPVTPTGSPIKGPVSPSCSFSSTSVSVAHWPTASSTVNPHPGHTPASKLQAAYEKADASIQQSHRSACRLKL